MICWLDVLGLIDDLLGEVLGLIDDLLGEVLGLIDDIFWGHFSCKPTLSNQDLKYVITS
jgi:hypothetical protein